GSEKGKKGKILKAFPTEGKVVVDKLHMFKKNVKPSKQDPKGGIVEKERKVDISNVMLLCPKCNAKTRVAFKHLEDGDKVRVCKKCNEVID
ncbi:MAG: 50S ribosomal protein L24, partial [Nitrospinae bacterium]|nr:50S ribosomal protein L24 [Nitrospinota bacterium]